MTLYLSETVLLVATWNVRTLVESVGGDRRNCRSRPQRTLVDCAQVASPHLVDCNLDLLVKVLRRYRVSVAGIQETKWFVKDVWQADGYTFLHSGRPLCEDGPTVRNKRVGLALDETTSARKEAGEVWNAVSSRIVTARLKVSSVGQRRPQCSRETRKTYVSVMSVYAPTAKAPPGVAQSSWRISKIQVRKFQRQMCLLFLEISMLELAVVQQRMNCGQGYMEGMVLVLAMRLV